MNPPNGAWFERTRDGFVLGTTTRHPAAVLIAPFCAIFSFALLATPMTMVEAGRLEPLHALPVFALNGVAVLLATASVLMTTYGKVTIEVQGADGRFFMGIGSVGVSRRFRWDEVTEVRSSQLKGSKGGFVRRIELRGASGIAFGSGLTIDRFDYMLTMLRDLHRERTEGATRPGGSGASS